MGRITSNAPIVSVFSLCDSLKETPVGKRGTDFRSSFFLITRYRNIYKLHRETEKQGFLYLRIYEAAFPIKGALNRPTPHYYALITHFLAKVTIYFLFFFYIFKVKEKYSYLYKLWGQLNNKLWSAVQGLMQTLNYKKPLLTMKHMVTYVDATEQTEKTGEFARFVQMRGCLVMPRQWKSIR